MENKLRETCDNLLGPVTQGRRSTSSGATAWQDTTLGYKKRALLEEVLPLIASNLQLQRLYTEYKEQLEVNG